MHAPHARACIRVHYTKVRSLVLVDAMVAALGLFCTVDAHWDHCGYTVSRLIQ